ncbi:glycosyltransferase family A protein [Neisseria sp.]|uniref:glycosyltransferase family A protein n=1 Tax=Neisseria sp. TaxID=192066 RepID=UPI0026DC007A|nr:glycosyltransferase family A protein [Neisseria sp.]MDO4907109.1 glycosyltransferase family A protein [Neisseria sp.]
MKNPHISLPPATIIMTFHGEDVYAHKSLLGFQRIRNYSAKYGNRIDLICILDCANAFTSQTVKNYLSRYGSSKDQVIESSNGSLSASRNIGIDHTRTEYVGFLDGDDFFSSNWVSAALRQSIQSGSPILCMPGHVLSFGRHIGIQAILPSRKIPQAQMMNSHYWVSSVFSQTDIFKQFPYNEKIGRQTKFAFEDWDFNLRCIAAGIEIVPVLQTYLFYRRRDNSMLQEHIQYNSLIPPSGFFSQLSL